MNKIVSLLAVTALASADSFSSYNAPGGRGSSGGSSGGSLSGASFVGTSGPTHLGTSAPRLVGGGGSIGGGSIGGGSIGGGSIGGGSIGGGSGGGEPEITRNIYLYAAPAQAPAPVGPAPQLPARKVHYNFVFVRTSNLAGGAKPIVAPAPQQKTLVYLLSKRPGPGQQEVIEVPHNPTQPEVFFVNYDDGDNTQLPGGVSLQQALSQSVQQGQVIQGGGSGGAGGATGGSGVFSIGGGSGHGSSGGYA